MELYKKNIVWAFSDGSMLMLDNSSTLSAKPKVYIVPTNVTLLDISLEFYSNHTDWHKVARANDIIDPYSDISGMTLIIP